MFCVWSLKVLFLHNVHRPIFYKLFCRGGYLLRPERFEFWQGQTNRLHDRFLFRKPETEEQINRELTHEGDDGWVFERLSS